MRSHTSNLSDRYQIQDALSSQCNVQALLRVHAGLRREPPPEDGTAINPLPTLDLIVGYNKPPGCAC